MVYIKRTTKIDVYAHNISGIDTCDSFAPTSRDHWASHDISRAQLLHITMRRESLCFQSKFSMTLGL